MLVPRFTCPFCGKSFLVFFSEGDFETLLEYGKSPYQCMHCGKMIPFKSENIKMEERPLKE